MIAIYDGYAWVAVSTTAVLEAMDDMRQTIEALDERLTSLEAR